MSVCLSYVHLCFPGPPEDHVGLAEVVTPDILRPLASSEEAQGQLADHLPPTSESTESVLTSPQFRQAVGVFGSALQSGELGPLMTQFGLGEEVAMAAASGGRELGLRSQKKGSSSPTTHLFPQTSMGLLRLCKMNLGRNLTNQKRPNWRRIKGIPLTLLGKNLMQDQHRPCTKVLIIIKNHDNIINTKHQLFINQNRYMLTCVIVHVMMS